MLVRVVVVLAAAASCMAAVRVTRESRVFRENADRISEAFHKGEISWSSKEEDATEEHSRIGRSAASSVDLRWKSTSKCSTGMVRHQQTCGSCWAFATSQAIYDQACLQDTALPGLLSPQDLVGCVPASLNCNGCDGGTFEGAILHISRSGIALDSCERYVNADTYCSSRCKKYNPIFDARWYTGADNMRSILNAGYVLMAQIDATDEFMQYTTGIFQELWHPSDRRQNHAVMIVGYGTSGAGVPYWIMKNSWGTEWGAGGYAYIRANKNDLGIESFESYAISTRDVYRRRSANDTLMEELGRPMKESSGALDLGQPDEYRDPSNADDQYLKEAHALSAEILQHLRSRELTDDGCDGSEELRGLTFNYAERQRVAGISYRLDITVETSDSKCQYRAIIAAFLSLNGTWTFESVLMEPVSLTASNTHHNQASSNNGMTAGATAGVVIGVMALVAAVVGVAFAIRRRRSFNESLRTDESLRSVLAYEEVPMN